MSDEPNDRKRSKSSEDADELREIAKALPELFSAINESVPKLISGIIGSVYSPEAAGNMGAAVGQFYKKLIEEGIPEEVALDMTKKFVGALDFEKIIGMATDGIQTGKRKKGKINFDWDDEDDDEE
ncbi:MAG: hypothetical protein ACXAEF_03505 [Candidatus Thorarchaeota archaeon]|jgi:hypothetical protein